MMVAFHEGYSSLGEHIPAKSIPRLSKLETRMYNSIARQLKRTNREFLRKEWLVSKTKKEAKILIGRGSYNPKSDDLKVEFQTKVVKL